MSQRYFPTAESLLNIVGACSVIGRSPNSAGVPASISASTNGTFLGRRSDALSFLSPRLTELTWRGVWAYRTATQTISNATWTAINFNLEFTDTDSYHDTSTNNSRITAATAGNFLVIGFVNMASHVGVTRLAFRQDGSTYTWQQDGHNNEVLSQSLTVVGLWAAAATNYIELMIYQNSGGAFNVNSAYFVAIPIGA